MENIDYHPPGKVAAQFHADNSRVRGLMGCVGSGKSSSCCVEILSRALRQKPYNGVRKSRWAVIRNTYPELKSTTIKTWETWFNSSVAPIKWDTPITSTMKIGDIGDGTALELEVVFLAMDRAEETGKLRSLELTGAWINEASEVHKDIFDMVTQRVGRYPSVLHGGASWYGTILDTNPPDDDHWYYKLAEEETPKGWKFFRQPGGLYLDEDGEYKPNPEAENIMNLVGGYDYYLNMIGGKNENWINVFCCGNYGRTSTGKVVYPEYKDAVHSMEDGVFEPVRGLPILLGWDFGLTPACVMAQQLTNGRLMVFREIVSFDMGIRQFANDVVKPILTNEYSGFRLVSLGDPAGSFRSQVDERTCLQELLEAGIYTEPAATNDFLIRREAVAYFLTRMVDGEPGFMLSKECRTLRKGFNGGYHFDRIKAAGDSRYKDKPSKNDYSHAHDALQYLCLGLRGVKYKVDAKPVVTSNIRAWA